MKKVIFIYILFLVNLNRMLFGGDLPVIKLENVDDKEYTNMDFIKSEFVCIIFYSNHCRISQQFEFAIKKIAKKFQESNSTVVVVSPNNENAIIPDELAYSDLSDGFDDMKKRYLRRQFNFPFLYDGRKQTLSTSLQASTTPQAFLYNQERKLIYNGRIGDYNEPKNLEKSDLLKAYIEACKGNQEFLKTKVHGSSIKSSRNLEIAEQVKRRYSKERVTIREIEKPTLEFYLEFGTKNPSIFYLWETTDTNSRENLLALSEIFKIFRKRGFKLYTFCVGNSKENALVCLNQAQLSSINFYIPGKDITPLTQFIPPNSRSITPLTVFLGTNKKILLSEIGKIEKQQIKKILVDKLK